MLDFQKRRDKTSSLLRNAQRQVSFHIYRSFGIIHIKCCVRLYLVFVFPKGQYKSKYGLKSDSMKVVEKIHNPVISANIHRYVNYFDIQVLMMFTETETLTSTLHNNIFTYLGYVFSATFIYIYIHIYTYIYIYIYIYTYIYLYIYIYIYSAKIFSIYGGVLMTL